jgi:hypothetical protein
MNESKQARSETNIPTIVSLPLIQSILNHDPRAIWVIF